MLILQCVMYWQSISEDSQCCCQVSKRIVRGFRVYSSICLSVAIDLLRLIFQSPTFQYLCQQIESSVTPALPLSLTNDSTMSTYRNVSMCLSCQA